MPTVLRLGGFRIGFYSGDVAEPPHVHVDRERFQAKFWLAPVRLARNGGFRPHELKEIAGLLEEHERHLLQCWYEYFG